jgi:hypothetical protein
LNELESQVKSLGIFRVKPPVPATQRQEYKIMMSETKDASQSSKRGSTVDIAQENDNLALEAEAPAPMESKSQDNSDIENGSILEAEEARSIEKSKDSACQESPSENVVSWDGPDDPANPMNWSSGRK